MSIEKSNLQFNNCSGCFTFSRLSLKRRRRCCFLDSSSETARTKLWAPPLETSRPSRRASSKEKNLIQSGWKNTILLKVRLTSSCASKKMPKCLKPKSEIKKKQSRPTFTASSWTIWHHNQWKKRKSETLKQDLNANESKNFYYKVIFKRSQKSITSLVCPF